MAAVKRNKTKNRKKKQTEEQLPPKFLLADHIYTDFLSEHGTNKAAEEILESLSSMSLEVS